MEVKIEGKPIKAHLDTGAYMTIVASDVLTSSSDKPLVLHRYKGGCLDYNGNPINIIGKVPCQVTTPTGDLHAEILVYNRNLESNPWTPSL